MGAIDPHAHMVATALGTTDGGKGAIAFHAPMVATVLIFNHYNFYSRYFNGPNELKIFVSYEFSAHLHLQNIIDHSQLTFRLRFRSLD